MNKVDTTNQIIQNPYNTKYELAYSQVFDKLPGCSKPITLYRIRALRDIYINDLLVARTGDYGGWIEKEDNLSAAKDANCWIAGYVNGERDKDPCGFCEVDCTAKVYGNAKVQGNAYINYNCFIYGHAFIINNAKIYNSRCFGHAMICENAFIWDGSYISGKASIRGNASVRRSHLSNGHVYGNINMDKCNINKPYNIGTDPDKLLDNKLGYNFNISGVNSKNYTKTDFDICNKDWCVSCRKDKQGNLVGQDNFMQYRIGIKKD